MVIAVSVVTVVFVVVKVIVGALIITGVVVVVVSNGTHCPRYCHFIPCHYWSSGTYCCSSGMFCNSSRYVLVW